MTCKDCIHSGLCYKENDYDNFPDRCGEYISDKVLEERAKCEWIPVSERLPEKSGKYWCTFGVTNLTGSDYYTTESDAKKLFDDSEEYIGWQSQNVIAWMPLPKPYKGVNNEQ